VNNLKKLLPILFFILVILSACNSSINDKEYYYKQLNLNDLWTYSKGASQTIAFIDTGISDSEKDNYKARIIDTYNSVNGSKNVIDENGHGTQIISVAASNGEHEVFGIAPKVKIIVIKAIGGEGVEQAKSIVKAIDYAILKKADIINLSLGANVPNEELREKINTAIANNITVVASTGDYGQKDTLFPANMAGVVSVEAKNQKGLIWENSNTSKSDITAFPGVNINNLTLNDKTFRANGTSQATAMASGYVALLRDFYVKKKIPFNNAKIITELRSINAIKDKNANYLKPFKKY
jgi:hypothetical protein